MTATSKLESYGSGILFTTGGTIIVDSSVVEVYANDVTVYYYYYLPLASGIQGKLDFSFKKVAVANINMPASGLW